MLLMNAQKQPADDFCQAVERLSIVWLLDSIWLDTCTWEDHVCVSVCGGGAAAAHLGSTPTGWLKLRLDAVAASAASMIGRTDVQEDGAASRALLLLLLPLHKEQDAGAKGGTDAGWTEEGVMSHGRHQ